MNVYEFTGYGAGKLATEAHFKSQTLATFSRRHALCAARALRLAHDAAARMCAGPNPTTAPPEGLIHRLATG